MADKKLDAAKISALSSLILVGVRAAGEVWEALNKDDRVSTQVKELGARLQNASAARTPTARLQLQLDEVETYAAEAANDPAKAPHAPRWSNEARQIRQKLPLVDTLGSRDRRRHLKSLAKRTKALLDDIITTDVNDGVDAPVSPPQAGGA